jgi:hypothetical protein
VPLLTDDPKATDQAYINLQKDLFWLEPPDSARKHVEELYAETSSILDKKFVEQCKYNFHSCYAEMYFASVLQNRCGYELTHPSDTGPDFFIPKLNSWLEVVSLTDGKEGNPNSIPKAISGQVSRYPEDKVILRMCNAFETKAKKMVQDIEKGIIQPNEPIIVCISGGGLEERIPMYPEGGYPQIVKALLPVGALTFWFSRDSRELVSREYEYRESINKVTQNGDLKIGTEAFLNDNHTHVSAVIYSWADAGNPIERERWGSDFYIIHNPRATNPLPSGFAKCGIEYSVTVKPDSFTLKPAINHEES